MPENVLQAGPKKRGLISRQLVSFEVIKMACRAMEPKEFENVRGDAPRAAGQTSR